MNWVGKEPKRENPINLVFIFYMEFNAEKNELEGFFLSCNEAPLMFVFGPMNHFVLNTEIIFSLILFFFFALTICLIFC
jgi:hypothetical protein